MQMKALNILIPIWTNSIPPTNENENDFILPIGVGGDVAEDVFYLVVRWSKTGGFYYGLPVNVLTDGKLEETEVHLTDNLFVQLQAQLIQLGIRQTKNIVDKATKAEIDAELKQVHPSLVPAKET
jgi:hypothetical protein